MQDYSSKYAVGSQRKDKSEFVGRYAPAGNSCLSIAQNRTLPPDTRNVESNREGMLENCRTTSHELSAATRRKTEI